MLMLSSWMVAVILESLVLHKYQSGKENISVSSSTHSSKIKESVSIHPSGAQNCQPKICPSCIDAIIQY